MGALICGLISLGAVFSGEWFDTELCLSRLGFGGTPRPACTAEDGALTVAGSNGFNRFDFTYGCSGGDVRLLGNYPDCEIGGRLKCQLQRLPITFCCPPAEDGEQEILAFILPSCDGGDDTIRDHTVTFTPSSDVSEYFLNQSPENPEIWDCWLSGGDNGISCTFHGDECPNQILPIYLDFIYQQSDT